MNMRATAMLGMLLLLTCFQGDLFLQEDTGDETIITVDSTNLLLTLVRDDHRGGHGPLL